MKRTLVATGILSGCVTWGYIHRHSIGLSLLLNFKDCLNDEYRQRLIRKEVLQDLYERHEGMGPDGRLFLWDREFERDFFKIKGLLTREHQTHFQRYLDRKMRDGDVHRSSLRQLKEFIEAP